MSTEIDSSFKGNSLRVRSWPNDTTVALTPLLDGQEDRRSSRVVSRADFLAAVAAECGVIVIDRAELPPIEHTDIHAGLSGQVIRTVLTAGDAPPAKDAAKHRSRALGHLALAEYLDAHPPIDEAQVEALAEVVTAAYDAGLRVGSASGSGAFERFLVERGVRVEGGRA